MPKNLGKGGKHYRQGKHQDTGKRELIFRGEEQLYAQVTKLLGNERVAVACFDGHPRIAHIRGAMRKKVWINVNDIVLVSLRDYQDDKADIIHRYTPEEARKLQTYGEIPKETTIDETPEDVTFNEEVESI